MSLPLLYSFRRCPYAMRARLGLYYSQTCVELREIILKDKPQHMLSISPKATVPVLQLASTEVIDESFDIAVWALSNHDPLNLLRGQTEKTALIEQNDTTFKHYLDRYKYADRFPEQPIEFYRDEAMSFIQTLNELLREQAYLGGDSVSLEDIAIVPFVRQFAHVDIDWFKGAGCDSVLAWMTGMLESPAFIFVMKKYPLWKADTIGEYFDPSKAQT